MRKANLAVAFVAALGWSVAAHAGSVTQSYDIDDAWGASGKTAVHSGIFSIYVNFTAKAIDGTLTATVSTPNSTFTGSVPPSSAYVHVVGNNIQGWGTRASGTGTTAYTIMGTVMAQAAGSTRCHVGASGAIAASCSGTFDVSTWAHCTGSGCATNAVGSWPNGASSVHSQMWQAKSVHLGGATISHGHSSNHFIKSFQVKLTPPGNHLASSNSGYQTFHLGAKQTQ